MRLMLGNWKPPARKCATQFAILSEAYMLDDSIIREAEPLGFLENNASFVNLVIKPFWQHCNQARRHSKGEAVVRIFGAPLCLPMHRMRKSTRKTCDRSQEIAIQCCSMVYKFIPYIR